MLAKQFTNHEQLSKVSRAAATLNCCYHAAVAHNRSAVAVLRRVCGGPESTGEVVGVGAVAPRRWAVNSVVGSGCDSVAAAVNGANDVEIAVGCC